VWAIAEAVAHMLFTTPALLSDAAVELVCDYPKVIGTIQYCSDQDSITKIMGNEMIPRIQIMREDWASVWPTKVEILTMLNACIAKVNYAFGDSVFRYGKRNIPVVLS